MGKVAASGQLLRAVDWRGAGDCGGRAFGHVCLQFDLDRKKAKIVSGIADVECLFTRSCP